MKNEEVHQQNRLYLRCQYQKGTNRMLGQGIIATWSDSFKAFATAFFKYYTKFLKIVEMT